MKGEEKRGKRRRKSEAIIRSRENQCVKMKEKGRYEKNYEIQQVRDNILMSKPLINIAGSHKYFKKSKVISLA